MLPANDPTHGSTHTRSDFGTAADFDTLEGVRNGSPRHQQRTLFDLSGSGIDPDESGYFAKDVTDHE